MTKQTETRTPVWTCPNCQSKKFDHQREMIEHALLCKQKEDEQ